MENYDSFECLRVEVRRHVAFVRFAHGPINVLDVALVTELARLAELFERDEDVRVAVFASKNPDYFLSHAELRLLQQLRDRGTYDTDEMPFYCGLLERFRNLPIATIAQVEGRARGGGAEFVLAMDMSFGAVGRASLSLMEIVLGMLPGGGGAQFLSRKIGRSRAMELCLGGADVPATLAERYGCFNRALPAEELGPFVDELAFRIASYSRQSIALNKAAVNLLEAGRSGEHVTANRWFAELVKSPEFDRRVERFLAGGGQTRAGELEDFATWAGELA